MACPYPVKPKISERAPINGSPGDFFVSEEVLEMPRGTSAGHFQKCGGGLAPRFFLFQGLRDDRLHIRIDLEEPIELCIDIGCEIDDSILVRVVTNIRN